VQLSTVLDASHPDSLAQLHPPSPMGILWSLLGAVPAAAAAIPDAVPRHAATAGVRVEAPTHAANAGVRVEAPTHAASENRPRYNDAPQQEHVYWDRNEWPPLQKSTNQSSPAYKTRTSAHQNAPAAAESYHYPSTSFTERTPSARLREGKGIITDERLQSAFDAVVSSFLRVWQTIPWRTTRERTLRVKAHYECPCGRWWQSAQGQIKFTIFGTTVRLVEVYGQKCKTCQGAFIEPEATDVDLQETMQYLCDSILGRQQQTQRREGQDGPPHIAELCQACSTGQACSAARRNNV
jgi:hypothetical protein